MHRGGVRCAPCGELMSVCVCVCVCVGVCVHPPATSVLLTSGFHFTMGLKSHTAYGLIVPSGDNGVEGCMYITCVTSSADSRLQESAAQRSRRSQPAVPPHAIMPSCHRAIVPSCHHTIIPSCHHANMPSYHHANMPSCHHAIMPSCHHANMPSYHHANMPSCYHAIMLSFYIMPSATQRVTW
jgi:hypothetical protein